VKNVRLFIAMDFSSQIILEVTIFQNKLRSDLSNIPIRWVAPETMHLTLQFLGDVPQSQIPAIQEAISTSAAGFSVIPLHIGSIGSFPSYKNPQVLWLGISANQTLKKIATQLQAALQPLGFKPEKDFLPHLTLGRLNKMATREQQNLVSAVLARWQSVDIGEDRMREVILYQSDLTQRGPIYTALFRFPLKNVLN
jgi:2'-5' RNA ligase